MSRAIALQTGGWLDYGRAPLALLTDGMLSLVEAAAQLPIPAPRIHGQVTMRFSGGIRSYRLLIPGTTPSFVLRADAPLRAAVEVGLAMGPDDVYERLAAYVAEAILSRER